MSDRNYRRPPAGGPSTLRAHFDQLVQLPQTDFGDRHPVVLRAWQEERDGVTTHSIGGVLKFLTADGEDVLIAETHEVLTYEGQLVNRGCSPEHCGTIRAIAKKYGALIVAATGIACGSPYEYATEEIKAMDSAQMLHQEAIRGFDPALAIDANGHQFQHPLLRSAAAAIGLFVS